MGADQYIVVVDQKVTQVRKYGLQNHLIVSRRAETPVDARKCLISPSTGVQREVRDGAHWGGGYLITDGSCCTCVLQELQDAYQTLLGDDGAVLQYVPVNSLLVVATPEAARRLALQPTTAHMQHYSSEFKVSRADAQKTVVSGVHAYTRATKRASGAATFWWQGVRAVG